MNLINFIEQFPDEPSCRVKFKEFRDKQGIVCRKCNHTEHYWMKSIEKYECKNCKTRTSLRSGTVMHASNLPFRYWFIAMHLLTSTKKSFSALELQRQIGHKNYEPIWYMLQKLRKTMGLRDRQYKLNDVVELDEGFFSSVNTESSKEDDEKKKRGRGSQSKSTVMVMASTSVNKTSRKKHKKSSRLRFVKMQVLQNMQSETVVKQVQDNIDSESVVKSDNYTSYSKIKDNVWCHFASTVKPKDADKVLPWVHTAISNAKRSLLGTYHMVSMKYIQDYLDEFCYKVNRRYFDDKLFDRLMIACVSVNYKNHIIDS